MGYCALKVIIFHAHHANMQMLMGTGVDIDAKGNAPVMPLPC